MSTRQAHAIQIEVEKTGVAAVDYPIDPKKRQKFQAQIHQISRRYGIRVRTRRMFVDGEDLLVVWRVG